MKSLALLLVLGVCQTSALRLGVSRSVAGPLIQGCCDGCCGNLCQGNADRVAEASLWRKGRVGAVIGGASALALGFFYLPLAAPNDWFSSDTAKNNGSFITDQGVYALLGLIGCTFAGAAVGAGAQCATAKCACSLRRNVGLRQRLLDTDQKRADGTSASDFRGTDGEFYIVDINDDQ